MLRATRFVCNQSNFHILSAQWQFTVHRLTNNSSPTEHCHERSTCSICFAADLICNNGHLQLLGSLSTLTMHLNAALREQRRWQLFSGWVRISLFGPVVGLPLGCASVERWCQRSVPGLLHLWLLCQPVVRYVSWGYAQGGDPVSAGLARTAAKL